MDLKALINKGKNPPPRRGSLSSATPKTNGLPVPEKEPLKKEAENPIPLLFLGINSFSEEENETSLLVPKLSDSAEFMKELLTRNLSSPEHLVIRLSWWNYIDAAQERFALAVADFGSYNLLLDWVSRKEKYTILAKDSIKEAFKAKKMLGPSNWRVVCPSVLGTHFNSGEAVINALVKEHALSGEFSLQKPEDSSTAPDFKDPRSEWVLSLNLSNRAELGLGIFSVKEKDGRVKTVLSLAGLPTFWSKVQAKHGSH